VRHGLPPKGVPSATSAASAAERAQPAQPGAPPRARGAPGPKRLGSHTSATPRSRHSSHNSATPRSRPPPLKGTARPTPSVTATLTHIGHSTPPTPRPHLGHDTPPEGHTSATTLSRHILVIGHASVPPHPGEPRANAASRLECPVASPEPPQSREVLDGGSVPASDGRTPHGAGCRRVPRPGWRATWESPPTRPASHGLAAGPGYTTRSNHSALPWAWAHWRTCRWPLNAARRSE